MTTSIEGCPRCAELGAACVVHWTTISIWNRKAAEAAGLGDALMAAKERGDEPAAREIAHTAALFRRYNNKQPSDDPTDIAEAWRLLAILRARGCEPGFEPVEEDR